MWWHNCNWVLTVSKEQGKQIAVGVNALSVTWQKPCSRLGLCVGRTNSDLSRGQHFGQPGIVENNQKLVPFTDWFSNIVKAMPGVSRRKKKKKRPLCMARLRLDSWRNTEIWQKNMSNGSSEQKTSDGHRLTQESDYNPCEGWVLGALENEQWILSDLQRAGCSCPTQTWSVGGCSGLFWFLQPLSQTQPQLSPWWWGTEALEPQKCASGQCPFLGLNSPAPWKNSMFFSSESLPRAVGRAQLMKRWHVQHLGMHQPWQPEKESSGHQTELDESQVDLPHLHKPEKNPVHNLLP